MRLAAATAVTCVFVMSCSRASTGDALDAVQKHVHTSVDEGLGQSDVAFEADTVTARYNPARCDCPDFEIFIYGRWVRVRFEGNSEATERIKDEVNDANSSTMPEHFEVRGKLDRARNTAKPEAYPVFELDST